MSSMFNICFMKKTMVYLEEIQFAGLSQIAKKRGTSFSQLMREAVEQFIDRENPKNKRDSSGLRTIIGMGSATEDNSDSILHDQVLYKND